jgi:opacity protein-like surface antigen
MIRVLAVALLVIFAVGIASAQQEKTGGETKVVIQQVHEQKDNYYTVRVGAWFPKDKEQGVTLDDIAFDKTEGAIEESQALGLDFHFRKNVGHPFYTDLSVGGWYTTYEFTPNLAALPRYDAWSLIVPVTIGLSVAPLPDNPFQPYAMVGLGAYIGFTGHDALQVSDENVPDDTDTYIRFGYFAGLGIDFMFAESFGISVGVKYQFVKFEEGQLFTGQQDFTGLQAQVGVAMKI